MDDEATTAWTRENVARLIAEWPLARALLDRVYDLMDWLEVDAERHFEALVTAALGGEPAYVPAAAGG